MAASATGNSLLANRVAVISGGLGDIGRATARVLQAAGARVALSDLKPTNEAARMMPEFHYSRVDVTKPAEIDRWLARVGKDLGVPSLVICNAAIVELGSALETTPESWQRTLNVNLSGSYFLAQSAARTLLEHKQPGRIVMVGSWAAHAPHARITTYSVAKAGLRMAMKCLAVELAPHGILVNELAPGKVNAGLTAQLLAKDPVRRRRARGTIPLGQLLEADDVAAGVLQLCHPDNRHMTGSVVLMDGGLSLVLPR
jgi:NAD(P)-dependent dehydrogenase (short-subunit alcohol dehydrogenase family)